jgi:hypothetical protein
VKLGYRPSSLDGRWDDVILLTVGCEGIIRQT